MTVAQRLREARQARFVGREGELALFRRLLDRPVPGVLFLHGPGGVGKSTLLAAFADAATAAGREVLRLDARLLEPTPGRFLAAAPAPAAGQVLLLDTFEQMAPASEWLRETYLPSLPEDGLVVIAGREPPEPAWVSDAGWRELLRVVSLRNLRAADTSALLRAEGVPEHLHEQIHEVTYGHPLALSLVAELLRRQPSAPLEVPKLTESPELVRVLLARFLDQLPSLRHRRALEVCARARFTTVDLLRHALGGEDADSLFDWLRARSFMTEDSRGLMPHELVRDMVDADLRWRDPSGYVALDRAVLDHLLRQIAASEPVASLWAEGERQQALVDLMFLHRHNPVMRTMLDFAAFGAASAQPVRPDDRPQIVSMTRKHEGPVCAGLVGYWMERAPEWMALFRSAAGRFIGFSIHLPLDRLTEADFAADPGAAAMWRYAQRTGIGPGEPVNAFRFFLDRDAYRDRSPSFAVLAMMSVQTLMVTPPLAMDLVGGLERADAVAGTFATHGYRRLVGEDFEVEGLWYGVFAHDFRRERPAPAGTDGPEPLALARPQFEAAVRCALRDLHRPDQLAANPLLRSRMLLGRAAATPRPADLVALLRETVETIGADPRDEKLRRVLDRTYLRPAANQALAAEVLGLPFSTYRRHLGRGVQRVVELLWTLELAPTAGARRG